MNKEEMIKNAYTLMVKNNPDEAVKTLIMLDNENKKLKHRLKLIKDYILIHSTASGSFKKGLFVIENIEEIHGGYELLQIINGECDEWNKIITWWFI